MPRVNEVTPRKLCRGRRLEAQTWGTLSLEEPTGTNQKWLERLDSWTEGREEVQRAVRELPGGGDGASNVGYCRALARRKKPLALATKRSFAGSSRVGSPPRLETKPDCDGSSSKREGNWQKQQVEIIL